VVADVAGTAAEIASEKEAFVWWQGKQRQWGRQTYWQRAVETERQQRTMAETEAAVVLEGKGAAVAAAATVGMVSVDNSGNVSRRQRRWKQR